jgi:hypothetical protein
MVFGGTYMLMKSTQQSSSGSKERPSRSGTETEPQQTTRRTTTSSSAAAVANKEIIYIAKSVIVHKAHIPATSVVWSIVWGKKIDITRLPDTCTAMSRLYIQMQMFGWLAIPLEAQLALW